MNLSKRRDIGIIIFRILERRLAKKFYLQIEHTKGANVVRKANQCQSRIFYRHQMLPKGCDHIGIHSDPTGFGEKGEVVLIAC